MVNKAVSNTGPILHLSEIGLLKVLNIFSQVIIPQEVLNELINNKIDKNSKIKIIPIKHKWKDRVKVLTNQYGLDIGESEAIALTMQEKADYFLTDDLDARTIAKNYGLEVHGTLGVILRAFREKIIKKDIAIDKIKELHVGSTLFITKDLIEEVIREINKY